MPRLARIELKDFKTFGPRKVSLEFDGGLTVITGPNGSGKSNLLDAILFALGELSPSRLRVRNLSELIRKGARKAVVRLFLDNSDGGLPGQPETICITRELRANGECIYKLNGRRVSRAELLRLLSAAGISPSGPNLVLQGTVMELATAGPRELRELIEDRLGLRSYEEERAEAEEKLRRAELAIREVRARLAEIGKRVRELERQANELTKRELITRELEALRAQELLSELKAASRELRATRERLRGLEERERFLTARREELRAILASGDLRELEELSRRLSDLSFRLGKTEGAIKAKRRRLRSLENLAQGLKEELSRARAEADSIRSRLEAIRREEEAIKRELEEARAEGKAVRPREILRKCVSLLSRVLSWLRGLTAKGSLTPSDLGPLERTLEEALGLLRELLRQPRKPKRKRRKPGELFRKLGSLEAEERLRREALRRLEEHTIPSLEQRLASAEREIEAVTHEIRELEGRLASLRDEIAFLREKERELASKKEELMRARDELASLEGELASLQRERLQLTAREALLAEHVRRLAGELRELCSRSHVREWLRGPLLPPELASRARELLSRELEAMGPVNQLAREQYERELARLMDLSAKLAKLREERDAIRTFIAEIEQRRREEFERAVQLVSERLTSVFSKLAGGGRAWLALQDPSDPMRSGIEIMAELPGKGLVRVRSASGGERSLVSLALLLALQSLTPSPFYVLDEVDAHLDQEHVKSFAELLKEMSREAQFIVITLRPDVAAVADRVIGFYYAGGTRAIRLDRGSTGWVAS